MQVLFSNTGVREGPASSVAGQWPKFFCDGQASRRCCLANRPGRAARTVKAWVGLMLVADLPVIALLVWAGRGTVGPWSDGRGRPWLRFSLVGVAVAMFAAGYVVAIAGKDSMPGQLAIFEPREWEGRRLPVLDEIDVGRDLSQGATLAHLHSKLKHQFLGRFSDSFSKEGMIMTTLGCPNERRGVVA